MKISAGWVLKYPPGVFGHRAEALAQHHAVYRDLSAVLQAMFDA